MTVRIPIFGSFSPDSGVRPSKLSDELTLTNSKDQYCYVIPFPTGTDIGGSFKFEVPQNYASDPAIVIKGIIDGTAANTIAFTVQQIAITDNETVDVAYEAEDIASASLAGYTDEDQYEEVVALTPASPYVAGDEVFGTAKRDDSVDTTTIPFLLTGLYFQYTES